MLIPNVEIPTGQKGDYRIERKYIKPDRFDTIRSIMTSGRYVPEGEYTFLFHKENLWMSDTPDEKRDHYKPVQEAKGQCLIAGLGIGMVLNAMLQKPEVDHVDVVEISQDVIDLVSPYFLEKYPNKVTFYCSDIYTWIPPKDKIYDVAWFDIWMDICYDNLEGMTKLHRKFGKKAKWKGSWSKELCLYYRQKDKRYGYR